jgi:hypothetical protein
LNIIFVIISSCNLRAISPALQPKKLQLQKIFGSNLQLQDQKIISTPQNQWAALRAAHKNCSDSELSCVLASLHPAVRTITVKIC